MNIQLDENQIKFLKEALIRPLTSFGCDIYVFGSRATFKANKFSDLDILIKADHYARNLEDKVSQIKEDLENSSFELKVDIVLERDLAKEYKKQVFEQMVKVFPTKP
jgi:predicted nucleotidyltransferase